MHEMITVSEETRTEGRFTVTTVERRHDRHQRGMIYVDVTISRFGYHRQITSYVDSWDLSIDPEGELRAILLRGAALWADSTLRGLQAVEDAVAEDVLRAEVVA